MNKKRDSRTLFHRALKSTNLSFFSRRGGKGKCPGSEVSTFINRSRYLLFFKNLFNIYFIISYSRMIIVCSFFSRPSNHNFLLISTHFMTLLNAALFVLIIPGKMSGIQKPLNMFFIFFQPENKGTRNC